MGEQRPEDEEHYVTRPEDLLRYKDDPYDTIKQLRSDLRIAQLTIAGIWLGFFIVCAYIGFSDWKLVHNP